MAEFMVKNAVRKNGLWIVLCAFFCMPSFGKVDCNQAYGLFFQAASRSYALQQHLARIAVGQGGVLFHYQHEKGWRRQARLAEDIARPVTQFVLPGLFNWWHSPTSRIFKKQWKQVSYKPTKEEKLQLKKYKAYREFLIHGRLVNAHPRWVRGRRYVETTADLLFKGIWLAVANHTVQQILGHDPCSDEDQIYARDPRCAPRADEVHLLIQSLPEPSLAIRLGNRVYRYGKYQVASFPSSEFLLSDRSNTDQESARWFIPGFFDRTFKDTPRTFQVAVLKLGKGRVEKLKQDLELQSFQRYDALLTEQSRSHAAMQVLKLDGAGVDTSPSGVGMAFSLRKSFGSSHISRVFMVKEKESSWSGWTLAARNAFMSGVDGTANLGNWIVAQPARLFPADAKEALSSAPRGVISESRKKAVQLEVENEEAVRMQEYFLLRLTHSESDAQRERYRMRLKKWVEPEIFSLMEDAAYLRDFSKDPRLQQEGQFRAEKLELYWNRLQAILEKKP